MHTVNIQTTKHHLSYMHNVFQTYVHGLQVSNLVNVSQYDQLSSEFLVSRIVNSLLVELEDYFLKKIVTSTGVKINLKLSESQGIALYKVLIGMPILKDDHYCHLIRQQWIAILHQELLIFRDPVPMQRHKPKINPEENNYLD